MTELTKKHWKKMSYLIQEWWPATEFTAKNEDAYYEILKEFAAEDVEAAIKLQLEQGNAFAPSCAQLLVAVRQMKSDPAPSFNLVFRWCDFAMKRWPANERIALHWLATQHEWAAEWAKEYGWDRLAHEPVDGDHGGAVRARIEKDWNAFVVRHDTAGRKTRALELVGGSASSSTLGRAPVAQLVADLEQE